MTSCCTPGANSQVAKLSASVNTAYILTWLVNGNNCALTNSQNQSNTYLLFTLLANCSQEGIYPPFSVSYPCSIFVHANQQLTLVPTSSGSVTWASSTSPPTWFVNFLVSTPSLCCISTVINNVMYYLTAPSTLTSNTPSSSSDSFSLSLTSTYPPPSASLFYMNSTSMSTPPSVGTYIPAMSPQPFKQSSSPQCVPSYPPVSCPASTGQTTVTWSINSFTDPCGSSTTSPGFANFKFGTLFWTYNYNGIIASGSMTQGGSINAPTVSNCVSSLSGLPFLQISDGWSTASCCAGYTLYLQTGTPPNTTVNIAINDNNLSPTSACGGAIITVQNDSYYPVSISTSGSYTANGFILLPSQNTSITCGSPFGNTPTSVQIGPDVANLSPITMLCTSVTGSSNSWSAFVDDGISSMEDCLGDVECAEALIPPEGFTLFA